MLAIPIAPEVVGLHRSARPGAHEQTATLINVRRGALVDIPALKQSLQDGHLRHFCTDVLPTEPWPSWSGVS